MIKCGVIGCVCGSIVATWRKSVLIALRVASFGQQKNHIARPHNRQGTPPQAPPTLVHIVKSAYQARTQRHHQGKGTHQGGHLKQSVTCRCEGGETRQGDFENHQSGQHCQKKPPELSAACAALRGDHAKGRGRIQGQSCNKVQKEGASKKGLIAV